MERLQKMFANELNFEQSSKLVDLVYKLAQIDSQYDFDKESFVDQLKLEFDVCQVNESASINDLVDYFSSQNEKIKKIVLFHVIFLIYSDTYLSESEKDTFNYIIEQFEIGSDEVEKIEELVNDFMDVNLRLKELIEL